MKQIEFIDTHCHIHDPEFSQKYAESADELLTKAAESGVKRVVCVGTDVASSSGAVEFATNRDGVYASIALHPHEAADLTDEQCSQQVQKLRELLQRDPLSVVAIGECGLDYYYHQSDAVKQRQKYLCRLHLELAQEFKKPLIFHIRDPKDQDSEQLGEAFADFMQLLDEFPQTKAVVHSFSASVKELHVAIERGLYIGLNGIMTFSKQTAQLDAAKAVPLKNLVLETDAPFLTPHPFRGKICAPEHLVVTAEFLTNLRGETIEQLATATTANAEKLFDL